MCTNFLHFSFILKFCLFFSLLYENSLFEQLFSSSLLMNSRVSLMKSLMLIGKWALRNHFIFIYCKEFALPFLKNSRIRRYSRFLEILQSTTSSLPSLLDSNLHLRNILLTAYPRKSHINNVYVWGYMDTCFK